jgi:hypothetical protein
MAEAPSEDEAEAAVRRLAAVVECELGPPEAVENAIGKRK